MKKYIQANSGLKTGIEYNLGGYTVLVSSPVDSNLVLKAFQILAKKLPSHYSSLVDIVYIGEFQNLKDRDLNALYSDNAIFATNQQDSPEDLVEDIIHETAHAVEERYTDLIYGDGLLSREFKIKRSLLAHILQSEGYDISSDEFAKTEYNKQLDEFFYQEIGYPTLAILSANIFFSPYGATSLREYWANGFECYYSHRKGEVLKKISKELYNKIVKLEESLNEERI